MYVMFFLNFKQAATGFLADSDKNKNRTGSLCRYQHMNLFFLSFTCLLGLTNLRCTLPDSVPVLPLFKQAQQNFS